MRLRRSSHQSSEEEGGQAALSSLLHLYDATSIPRTTDRGARVTFAWRQRERGRRKGVSSVTDGVVGWGPAVHCTHSRTWSAIATPIQNEVEFWSFSLPFPQIFGVKSTFKSKITWSFGVRHSWSGTPQCTGFLEPFFMSD